MSWTLGSTESIRAQAAAWVMRLQDAHSAQDRIEFEEWIAGNPAHQEAYDRALGTYQAAGALRHGAVGRNRDLAAAFPVRRTAIGPLATALAAGLVAIAAYQFFPGYNPVRPMALASVMLSTEAEPRKVLLDDGTQVSLAPASEVEVHLERKARLARVRKGRARFKVKPERRPFVIVAGDRQITVDEGVYDAEVRGSTGAVRSAASRDEANAADDPDRPDAVRANGAGAQPLLEFRAEPLARVVQRINGLHGNPPIEIGPGIADLPVTGVFQTGGSEALAASLAAAFDLKLARTGSGTLRLERKNR